MISAPYIPRPGTQLAANRTAILAALEQCNNLATMQQLTSITRIDTKSARRALANLPGVRALAGGVYSREAV